ncbi:MAG: hypothetical protein B1H05_02590 [Candidatus Cloacimonas sp. 4484_140]|nr:MAG: hypothetical protein B1H05_02590 [Candidatus Cloacimonas sp. 4484_140]
MSDKKKIILGILVGIVLLTVWLYFIDINSVLNHLKKVKIHFVILASFLYLLSYFIRSVRWQKILAPVCKIKIMNAFTIWIAGNFLNYIIPIRAGEFAKSYFLKRTKGVPISKSLPSIFIDKVFDSFSIFIVIALIPLLQVNISKPLLILIFLLIAVFIIGVGILIISTVNKPFVVKILTKFFFFIPKKFKTKFFEIIEIFVEGVGLFKHHSNILPSVIGLTIIAVLIDSVYFFFMFRAFAQVIPFPIILFGYTLIYLSYILPTPPAQIGSNELIMVLVFSVGLGLNKDMVSAVMAFASVI